MEKYNVGLVYPPLCSRFGYNSLGPRIMNLGQGYINGFLENYEEINSEIIDLDNYIHRNTSLWNRIDELGLNTDEKIIVQYMNLEYENEIYDEIYNYLLICCNWSKYKIIAIKLCLEWLHDQYTPIWFRLLKTIHNTYGTIIIIGGTGIISFKQIQLIKKFDFLKYLTFGLVDSINMEALSSIILYEKDHSNVDITKVENIIYRNENKAIKINISKQNQSPKIEKKYIIKPKFNLNSKVNYWYSYDDIKAYDSNFMEVDVFEKQKVAVIPYRFTIGCVNHCAFCMNSSKEQIFAYKDADDVADNLDRLIQETGSNTFLFLNSMINFSKKYLDSLHNEIKKRNLNILFTDSAEIHGMDQEILEMLRDIGCIGLWYGLECPSDKLLKQIHKNCTVEEAEDILKISDKVGIWNGVNLISGLPHETEEDVIKSRDFIKKNQNIVDMWSVTPFYLTNSKFLDYPEKYGIKVLNPDIVADRGGGNVMMASFDEIGGLQWNDKKKMILENYQFLLDTIADETALPNICNSTFLFLAYKAFQSDKNKVREILMKNYNGSININNYNGTTNSITNLPERQ